MVNKIIKAMQTQYPERDVTIIHKYKNTYIVSAPLKSGQPFGTGSTFIMNDDGTMEMFNVMSDFRGWQEAIHKEPIYKK